MSAAVAYYSQPAAANYYTPPTSSHSSHRQRGYRLCDQCGAAENPSVSKFRLCGGCMTTQYCSQDCQKAHWPSHKPICQHTASQISNAMQIQQQSAAALSGENLAKCLRKFTSAHAALLGWAGFQALKLRRVPANLRQNAFLVELRYKSGCGHLESHRRFSIAATHIVPLTYIRDPLVLADMKRREERSRNSGGIGTLVVLIQCASVSQVMPVEVDNPAKIAWDTRDDWPTVLNHFVEQGRTDFKPISTTPNGIYYG